METFVKLHRCIKRRTKHKSITNYCLTLYKMIKDLKLNISLNPIKKLLMCRNPKELSYTELLNINNNSHVQNFVEKMKDTCNK